MVDVIDEFDSCAELIMLGLGLQLAAAGSVESTVAMSFPARVTSTSGSLRSDQPWGDW
jgi:hypothetical protein